MILEQGRSSYAEIIEQQTQLDQHCWRFLAVILQWALSMRIKSSFLAIMLMLLGHPYVSIEDC